MPLNGLTVLRYHEPLLDLRDGQWSPTPQLVLGSDDELPDNSVERVTAYLSEGARKTFGVEKRVIIDWTTVQVYRTNRERERLFSVEQFLPNRIYVTEHATNEPSALLQEISKSL